MNSPRFIALACLLCSFCTLSAQLDSTRIKAFQRKAAPLVELSQRIMMDTVEDGRRQAVHSFIRNLVEVLQEPGAFHYPFQELNTISFVTAPDEAFRLITWQLRLDDATFRHYGAIQMNSGKRLQLIPLSDWSDTMAYRSQKVLSTENWLGCVYYNILQHEVDGQPHYTLFGFDGNDRWSNIKFMEVMHFEDGRPVFGKPLFSVTDSTGHTEVHTRFYREYRFDARCGLNFDAELDMIVFDHLIPYNPKYEGLHFTYVSDGSYQGFRFEEGRWVWVSKIFSYAINHPDNPPKPQPRLEKGRTENPLFGPKDHLD